MNNPRKVSPEEGRKCRLKCDDYMGDYFTIGFRKNYKKRPNVYSFKDGEIYWRFVYSDGEKINCQDIGEWEYI